MYNIGGEKQFIPLGAVMKLISDVPFLMLGNVGFSVGFGFE